MILDCCLLLTQTDKHLIKTVEKLFELNTEDSIHPSKHITLKTIQCSILKWKLM